MRYSMSYVTKVLLFLFPVLLPQSYSELSSKDASEGGCLEPTPKVPKGVNYAWVS